MITEHSNAESKDETEHAHVPAAADREPLIKPELEHTFIMLVEAIPELSLEEAHPDPNILLQSILKNNETLRKSDLSEEEQERVFFETLALLNSPHDSPLLDKATSTKQEIAQDRARRIIDPRTKHRYIFQEWPRDPKSEHFFKRLEYKGKETSNGIPFWGASLLDFYYIRRTYQMNMTRTISTSSIIVKWMKDHGEDFASGHLETAEEEEDPHIVLPCDIGQLIMDNERRIRDFKKVTWNPEGKKSKKGKAKFHEAWVLPANWPPKSPFSPLAYPSNWPRKPFDVHTDCFTVYPTLQGYIPHSGLPVKLIVHDPGRTLHASQRMLIEDSGDAPDITDIKYVYILTKSALNTAREESDEAESKTMEETRQRQRDEFVRDAHSNRPLPSGIVIETDKYTTLGPCAPPVFIVFPHQPDRARISEAHLYMSPRAILGQGGHSYVYRAEFELPRSFLVDEPICMQCVMRDAQDIIASQDRHGRDPKWDVLSGRHVLKYESKAGIAAELHGQEFLARAPVQKQEIVYEGPYRAIETRVKYQDIALGPYCEHIKDRIHPLTSKVMVAAKLSINGDPHLAREAKAYEQFPRHFFEHWNGYNVVPPLLEPTPVGALVPQYYGYYVVDRMASAQLQREELRKAKAQGGEKMDKEEGVNEKIPEAAAKVDGKDAQQSEVTSLDKGKQKEDSNKDETDSDKHETDGEQDREHYLSPILLMEECGKQVDPDKLSADDKNECASLFYRFHYANWVHGSPARRNIVRQPGPLSAWPFERAENMSKRGGLGNDWSYRLIDFGRSHAVERNIDTQEDRAAIDRWRLNGILP